MRAALPPHMIEPLERVRRASVVAVGNAVERDARHAPLRSQIRLEPDRLPRAIEDKHARRVDMQHHRLIGLSRAHPALHAYEGTECRLDVDKAFRAADFRERNAAGKADGRLPRRFDPRHVATETKRVDSVRKLREDASGRHGKIVSETKNTVLLGPP